MTCDICGKPAESRLVVVPSAMTTAGLRQERTVAVCSTHRKRLEDQRANLQAKNRRQPPMPKPQAMFDPDAGRPAGWED